MSLLAFFCPEDIFTEEHAIGSAPPTCLRQSFANTEVLETLDISLFQHHTVFQLKKKKGNL